MSSEAVFQGVGVALLTQFTDDGELAPEATGEHAAQLVEAGVGAVVVAGSTGEASSLEAEERLVLLDAVRAAIPCNLSVPVIAGTGGASGRQAAVLTAAACDHGADAVIALSPPRTYDPRPYYDAVAMAAGSTPVLAYHFPIASAPGITVEQLADLPIAGCKDSSGEAARYLQTLTAFSGSVWVGHAALLLLAGMTMSSGIGEASGAILAVANCAPELCLAALAGDIGAQIALVDIHAAAAAGFPAELKAMTARRFGTLTGVRIGG